VFSFDPENGKLELVERESIRGSCPRNFNIDPTGKWLIAAGQHSNTLALFEIDQETGELVFARQVANATAPICVLFPSETLPGG
jgi:6-phosphogluconolactonase